MCVPFIFFFVPALCFSYYFFCFDFLFFLFVSFLNFYSCSSRSAVVVSIYIQPVRSTAAVGEAEDASRLAIGKRNQELGEELL